MTAIADELRPAPRVPLAALATGFLTVSLFGFGGGIVWARRIAVEPRSCLSETEFLDIVALCQFLPGPNIIGIAVCTGTRMRGVAGALAAAAGFLVIPWSIGLAIGVTCLEHAHAPLVRNILGGISATAAGLLFATGLRLLLTQRRQPLTLIFAELALALMTLTKLPLLIVLFTLAPLSIGAAALRPGDRR